MKSRQLIAIVILILIAIAATLIYSIRKTRQERAAENSDLIGIDKLAEIDPAQMIGKLVKEIPVGIEKPKGIARDRQGRLYIAGRSVLILKADGSQLAAFDLPAPATCVAVDPDGLICIGFQDGVAVYNAEGKPQSVWENHGEKARLSSIAADDTHVFAADSGLRRVTRYDKSGKVLSRIDGRNGDGASKGFIIPSPYFDLFLDDEDSLWVVNPGRHVLQNYSADGLLRSSWGQPGNEAIEGFCGCCNPANFTMLADGRFVTAEKGMVRVKLYAQDGTFKGVIAGADAFHPQTKGLDLAADAGGR
ncbi:hypothetical protein ACFL4W_04580, partial [Planctomycetota bacterium]